ncbi:MAG: FAD-dependent oxidoreductase [Candidatus Heimdallarchaeota archaeon]
MARKIVIIGHGPAGMTAAGFAARTDREANITVLNAGEQDIYHPCALPYTIGGKLTVENIIEKARYQKISLLNNMCVKNINPQKKYVTAVNKEGQEQIFEYDALLIATGSEPIIPKQFIKGWDKEGVCVLKTPQDAQNIIKYAKTAKHAVVIGGSAIGIEVASELTHAGKHTTLIELMPTLMPGRLEPDMSQIVQTLLKTEGVDVQVNQGAKEITGQKIVKSVIAGDKEFPADVVVMATGVTPNTELAKAIGLEIGEKSQGIRINPRMETSLPGIFAAGDCVETINLITKSPMPMWLAGIATRQGRVAGINLAGGNELFPGALAAWIVVAHTFFVGGAGLSIEQAKKEGFDVVSAKLTPLLRPHYISLEKITVRLIADRKTGQLVGGQVIGKEGVAATVNYIVLAIMGGFTVRELTKVDWCYAPGAIECVNPLARVAEALLIRM